MGRSPDAGRAPAVAYSRACPTIRVNGVSLYYEEHGAGEPILCIHGTGSSAAFWRDAAAELATHGRAIVYDRRGCSRSERPEPFVTNVRQQADDAAALIDALGAAPAIVIGRSYGGEIAARPRAALPGSRPRAGAARGRRAARSSEASARWLADARGAGLRRRRGRHEHRRRDVAARRPRRCGLGGVARAVRGRSSPPTARRSSPRNAAASSTSSAEQLGTIVQPTLLVAARDSRRRSPR